MCFMSGDAERQREEGDLTNVLTLALMTLTTRIAAWAHVAAKHVSIWYLLIATT